jgi:hypothetical protein
VGDERRLRVGIAGGDGGVKRAAPVGIAPVGSVLIVFDRLFGTFAMPPRDELLRFGLEGRVPSNNPLVIALGEWRHLLVDTAHAKGLRARLEALLGAP